MKLWLDAQLSPRLATWLAEQFDVQAQAVKDLGLRDAEDLEIFEAAREARAVVMTKDRDFVDLLARLGPPPQVLWLTLGNTSNAHLKEVFGRVLADALVAVRSGEPLVEVTDAI